MSDKNLGSLQVYKVSLEISHKAWNIYSSLPNEFRFNIGSQFIRSVDSIGANIAEGYGRYHFKDKIKFYYNARGSLWESKHWFLLLYHRKLIDQECFESSLDRLDSLGKLLNAFIASTGNPNDK